MSQCSRFAEKLATKQDKLLDRGDIRRLRLAALLHDVGHCLFSHASEESYALLDEMQAETGDDKPLATKAPHEVLTVKLLRTEAFKAFFNEVITKYNVDCSIPQLETFILGSADPLSRYKSDILNGPFDTDKIDYLFRDGQFSGIPLTIDLDRLWYSTDIDIVNLNGKDWRRLVVDYSGTSPLEQILFDRVQLYPSLYHHPKVRASLCIFKRMKDLDSALAGGMTLSSTVSPTSCGFQNQSSGQWGLDMSRIVSCTNWFMTCSSEDC